MENIDPPKYTAAATGNIGLFLCRISFIFFLSLSLAHVYPGGLHPQCSRISFASFTPFLKPPPAENRIYCAFAAPA
jgi:hypothetical protein